MRADRDFYARETSRVAVDLIGCELVTVHDGQRLAGRIVETEAYLGQEDLASHAAMYRRGRETLSRDPGTVYIYRAYGIHMMFNIVAKCDAPYGAVLIRAVEPLDGVDEMLLRRGKNDTRKLTSGPGNVCQAFGFTLDDHLRDLPTDPTLWIEKGPSPDEVLVSPRIGITRSADLPLRFFDGGSTAVSGSRRGIVWTQEPADG